MPHQNMMEFIKMSILAVMVAIILMGSMIFYAAYIDPLEGFDTNNGTDLTKKSYTSYSDMVLQESINNRKKYLEEIKSRDVSESYPWIAIDGAWEQPSLFPSRYINPNKGEEIWNRKRQWVPRERKYRDFTDVVYVGNPLPQ